MGVPVLYVLATPIGNLQDITLRALALLQKATVIAAEDTRVARRLLAGLDVPLSARLLSARAHNEKKAAAEIVRAVQAGECVVYVSDAGTPAVSDPGAYIVAAARAAGVQVSPVPGASALTALLSVAALPDGSVHFYGFAPAAAGKRRRFLAALTSADGYSVFYEAPHRIVAMVEDLAAVFGGERRLIVGRELTKRYEQVIDAPCADVAAALQTGEIAARGEFVLAVENPHVNQMAADGWQVFEHLVALLPPRKAAAAAAKITGADAADLYRRHTQRR